MKLVPLGGKKPNELLAETREMCTRGHAYNIFFLFLFLQRLRSKLRIMLDEDDQMICKELMAKANTLCAKHSQQHGPVHCHSWGW
jgi:hypothetical protein